MLRVRICCESRKTRDGYDLLAWELESRQSQMFENGSSATRDASQAGKMPTLPEMNCSFRNPNLEFLSPICDSKMPDDRQNLTSRHSHPGSCLMYDGSRAAYDALVVAHDSSFAAHDVSFVAHNILCAAYDISFVTYDTSCVADDTLCVPFFIKEARISPLSSRMIPHTPRLLSSKREITYRSLRP